MTGTELDIRADGEHRYLAGLRTGGGATSEHVVEVPASLLADLNLEPADEPVLVRAILEILLDRLGPDMPPTLRLNDVEGDYPGLTEQLRAAVGR